MSNSSGSGGGIGCGGFILTCLIIWAFVFGVTWNGKHYEVSCSCAKGVVVQ